MGLQSGLVHALLGATKPTVFTDSAQSAFKARPSLGATLSRWIDSLNYILRCIKTRLSFSLRRLNYSSDNNNNNNNNPLHRQF